MPRIAGSGAGCLAGRAGNLLGWHKLGKQVADAGADLVADLPDHLDRLPGRVGQVPVFVALAGKDRQVSPQPMVITTSEPRTVSAVSIL